MSEKCKIPGVQIVEPSGWFIRAVMNTCETWKSIFPEIKPIPEYHGERVHYLLKYGIPLPTLEKP